MQVKKLTVTPLEKAEKATCGSKSAACAELARLAASSGSFRAAPGVCLPFGCMEAAAQVLPAGLSSNVPTPALYSLLHVKQDAKRMGELEALLKDAETAEATGGGLDKVCCALQELVATLPLPDATLRTVGGFYYFMRKPMVRK